MAFIRHRQKRTAAAVITCLLLSACTGGSANDQPASSPVNHSANPAFPTASSHALPAARAKALQAVLNSIAARGATTGGIPAALTAAVVTATGSWSGASGKDADGTRLAATAEIPIESISKTFTAAEVLHLASVGKIDLDAPMSRYVDNRLTRTGATVRQSLGMLSGLPQENFPPAANPNGRVSVLSDLANNPGPTAEPGRVQLYSNSNFQLLGLVVEKVAGVALATALRRDLIGPQHLDRIAVQDREKPTPPLGYPIDSTGARPIEDGYLPYRSEASSQVGAGSIAADAATVAKWGYQLYGGHVLSPALTHAMTTAQRPTDGKPIHYGLGTDLYPRAVLGAEAVGHDGGLMIPGPDGLPSGYTDVLLVVPSRQISLAVLIPYPAMNPAQVARELFDALT